MKQSQLITNLIDAFKRLPGVGPKSAQRLTYYLLERNRKSGNALAEALEKAMVNVVHCQSCRMLSETALCDICQDASRSDRQLCVVETPSDLMAIEATNAYNGKYFVLMGRLSPLDGIGPSELGLDAFEARLEGVEELIIATNATVEGEATAHYLHTLASDRQLVVSRLASGIPMGGELDYVDANTLARSFDGRQVM